MHGDFEGNTMKIRIMLMIALLAFGAGISARDIYIYNATNEKISLKGPRKTNNKAVIIPSEIEPGKILIKNLDVEGSVNDVLDIVYGGVSSGNFKKFSRKFTKPINIFKISWDSPLFAEIQSSSSLIKESSF